MQIHPSERDTPIVQWIKAYSGDRSAGMHKLIQLLWDKSTRGIFLAHNYHVSSYTKFPGTKIGFATFSGTVTQYDPKRHKYEVRKLTYEDQELTGSEPKIMKTKKWFYNSGEMISADHQKMDGSAFDYIIYLPKTSAL